MIGCDFGAPLAAGAQSRKTIVIEAARIAAGRYEITPDGRNKRLVSQCENPQGWPNNRRGWTLHGLAESIREDRTIVAAAFDFPFSIPLDLLQSAAFASRVGASAFGTRVNWVGFVGEHVELTFPTDSAGAKLRVEPILLGWRDKAFWIRRATDMATNAQPPLKHLFQNLFNMTLIGSKFLESLHEGGMQILRSHEQSVRPPDRSVFETYPAAVAAAVGYEGSYKRKPEFCLEAAEAYLNSHGITLEFNQEVRKFCLEYRTSGNDPDGADAFLCLVAAICFHEGIAKWHKGNATPRQLDEEGCIVTPAAVS